jgi:hypothetical protein
MSPMRPVAAVLCALVFVVAGCASAPETATSRPSATPSATATETPVAPTSAKKLTEGKDYEVVGTLPAQIDGSSTYWRGVDAEGMAYGDISVIDPKVDPGSMALNFYTQPVLIDPAGKLTRMAPVRDSGTRTQMTGADADARWVTWLESASSQVGSGQWTLFSYERATGKLRQLGSWKDEVAGSDSTLDYEGRPEILGDKVVMTAWSSVRGHGSGKILSAPLDGSTPLVELVAGAQDPDIDEQGFSYVDGSGALMYRDAATGKTRKLHERAGRGQCQLYRSDVLVTCAKTAQGVEVRIVSPDRVRSFGPFRSGVSYVELRDGWATFVGDADGDPQIYAVDAATGVLHHVSTSQYDWRLMGNGYALIVQRGDDREVSGYQLIKLR